MKSALSFLTCVFFILVISCHNREKDATPTLLLADSYMTTQPATALRILDSLNNTTIEKGYYFALLYAQAKYRNYIKADNDSLIKVALNYYSHCNDSVMKSRAFLVTAQIYQELGNNDKALNFIHISSDAASQITDYWTKSYIYYVWARLLRQAGDINVSTEKFEMSLVYANELTDTALIVSRMRELGYNYLAKNDYEQSLLHINRGIGLSKQAKLYYDLSMLYGRKAQVFFYFQNYREALRYIDEALLCYDNSSDKRTKSNLNFKGRLLLLNNRTDSVQYYLEQGKDTLALRPYYDCMSLLKEKHDRKAQPLNDEEIAELIDAINNCYDNFADKLRSLFPSLATNDVYLCCLVKIGLDNPALSAMLDISDNTLRKRKYRLKKEKIDPDQRYSTLEDAIHGI